jgi:hypothetical protein
LFWQQFWQQRANLDLTVVISCFRACSDSATSRAVIGHRSATVAIGPPAYGQTAVIDKIPMTVATANATAIQSNSLRRGNRLAFRGLPYRDMVPSLVILPAR